MLFLNIIKLELSKNKQVHLQSRCDVMRCGATYPLSNRTSTGALALFACVDHFLNPDGVTFLSRPTQKEEKQISYLIGQLAFGAPLQI